MTEAPIVHTFQGDRESVVEADAAADAAQMSRDGYVVTSQIWSRERVGILQGLFAFGRVRADVPRGTASLTVTYQRGTWTPDDEPV